MPVINIKMAYGRTEEKKQELVEALTQEVCRILDVKQEWVTIVIDEYARENWSTGGTLHSIKFGDGCGREGTDKPGTDRT